MNVKPALQDLNLLRVFASLWRERNVSKAAKLLGLSQPALSHSLSKLRSEMADDVFVRSAKGMTPTPKAEAWAPKVLGALASLESAFSDFQEFTPLMATGRITIVGTDLLEYILFPKLLSVLSKEAKDVVLVSRPSDGHFPKGDLERGIVDFAIAGFFGDLPEGFYHQLVAKETYVSIVRKNHPMTGKGMNLKCFQSLAHVLTSPQGDLYGAVDEALEKLGLKRKVVAGVSTFQVLGKLIAESDYCGTLPRSMAYEQSKLYPIDIFPTPVELNPIQLRMIWHQRTHTNPLHKWVRQKIQTIMTQEFEKK
ncbi:MAG: LysR family transcriptional regulator [Proteobacteria bacterium]|nr:LysR family transcriptional regulator [Pseudomonadota bacterium]